MHKHSMNQVKNQILSIHQPFPSYHCPQKSRCPGCSRIDSCGFSCTLCTAVTQSGLFFIHSVLCLGDYPYYCMLLLFVLFHFCKVFHFKNTQRFTYPFYYQGNFLDYGKYGFHELVVCVFWLPYMHMTTNYMPASVTTESQGMNMLSFNSFYRFSEAHSSF